MLQLALMGILVILKDNKSIGDKVSPRLLHFTLGGGRIFDSSPFNSCQKLQQSHSSRGKLIGITTFIQLFQSYILILKHD